MHRAPAETPPPLGGRIATGAERPRNDTFEKFTLSFRASAHTGVGIRIPARRCRANGTSRRRPLRSVTAHAVGRGALTPPHKGTRIPTPVTRSLARNDRAWDVGTPSPAEHDHTCRRAGGCRSLPLSIAESGKNGKPYAVSKGRSAASTPLYFRVR